MKYGWYIFKRNIEHFFLLPFIYIGRVIAYAYPSSMNAEVILFFPFYHTGGAEKVHADIAHVLNKYKCLIYFTRKSVDDTFLKSFKESGAEIKDIAAYTDNKFFYFLNLIYRGIISGHIHKNKPKLVFNGQCNFAYKLSPWIPEQIPQIELIHSFNSFSWIRVPYIQFYKKTVMIAQSKIAEHLTQYQALNIPKSYQHKIVHINNGINLPHFIHKPNHEQLKVLFVGRPGPEKRVALTAQVAASLENFPIHFTFVGDVQHYLPKGLLPFCSYFGNIKETAELSKIYMESDVLILLSTTEGFPVVVMEAMAHGCAILATPVGDIPKHVSSASGFVTSTSKDERTILEESKQQLLQWSKDKTALQSIQAHNIEYAKQHFSFHQFQQQYHNLVESVICN